MEWITSWPSTIISSIGVVAMGVYIIYQQWARDRPRKSDHLYVLMRAGNRRAQKKAARRESARQGGKR